MPKQAQWGPADIEVRLGAPFVTTDDYEVFCLDELGIGAGVVHEERTATWTMDFIDALGGKNAAKRERWATDDVDVGELFAATVRQEAIELRDVNKGLRWNATLTVRRRQLELNERFADWIWEDRKRAKRILAAVNERFPRRPREAFRADDRHWMGYCGPHTPRARQKAAVARIVASANGPTGLLLNHAVGAGKTLTMIAAARFMKRAGVIDKPMIVVPNHMAAQVATEATTSFPDLHVLVGATPAEVSDADVDLVIVTHAWFARVPASAAAMAAYKAELVADATAVLATDEADYLLDGRARGRLRSRARRAQRALDEVEDDDGWTFDDLGVDYLLVDEAHYYKRLSFPSRVGGFGVGSRRANDMAAKLWWLRRTYGAARVTFATGTPQSNSIAEIYTWQLLLAPDALKAAGIFSFDAWVSVFAEQRPGIEPAIDMTGYRLTTRLARFHNVGLLQEMLAEFTDTATAAELGLCRPKVRVETLVVDRSPELAAFQAELADYENPLAMCTASRLASLDPRLVGAGAPADGGKVRVVAERLAAELAEDPDALWLVFCDLGTPKASDAALYGWLRDELAAAGVDRQRIRFAHEATSAADKEALFEQCRTGDVSVIVGSTEKMGIGTNIQDRAKGGVHLDIGWKPDIYRQRRGRYERSGNRHDEVSELRIVTANSFDAIMWTANDLKSRAIAQLWEGSLTSGVVDDLDETDLGFAEALRHFGSSTQLVTYIERTQEVADLRRAQRLWRLCGKGPWPLAEQLAQAQAALLRLEQLISVQPSRKVA